MKSLEFILLLISLVGITFTIFALFYLLTFKKKRAYFESMKQELLKIKGEPVPRELYGTRKLEPIPEDQKRLLDEKKENFEAFISKLRKTELGADAEIYYRFVIYYQNLKDFNLAIDNFKIALSMNPNQKMIYFNMGGSHIRLENWQKAIECYKESIKRGEEEAPSYYNIGWIYDELKNYKEAIEYYERSLTVAYVSIYNKACAFAKWGKHDEAIKELEKIIDKGDYKENIKIDPDLEMLRKQGKLKYLLKRKPSKNH